MRTDIPSDVQSAADDTNSINAAVSATIYKTRQYFVYGDLDTKSNPFAIGAEVSSTPLGEDVKWSQRTYDIYSIYADSDVLKLETASSGVQTLQSAGSPLDTKDYYRPSIWSEPTYEAIWWSDDSVGLRYAELTGYTVSGTSSVWTGSSSIAVHAVDDREAVSFFIDDGGIGVEYVYYSAGSFLNDPWDFRFIDPTSVLLSSQPADGYRAHYSAAVKASNGDIHIFMTRYDGRVDVLIRHANGEWSDRRVAIPADLSWFGVTNAFIAPNGNFALVGQFQRIDDTGAFDSDFIYNLCSMSPDGKTFSMDRNTLFAMGNDNLAGNSMGHRFFAGVDTASTPNMWISSCGSNASDTAPLYLSDDTDTFDITKQMSTWCRGSYDGSLTIRVPDSQEAYFDHDYIHNGAVIDIWLEYMTADGYEPILLRRSIIDDISQEEGEASRAVTIQAEPYSLWKAREMTHPFYLELQSKQSIYDDVDAWDNLYEANSDQGLPSHLAVDLWTEKNVSPIEHAAGDKDSLLTDDLKTHAGYTVYPKVPAMPFEVSVYGWSRTGSNTPYTGGSGDQPSDSSADTDLITLRIIVERGASGNETEVDIEVTDISSTYSRFARTWYTSEAGSYPIVFSCGSSTGLIEGDTIKRIGVYAENVNGTDDTLYFIERIESTDIAVQIPQHGEIWDNGETTFQEGDPVSWSWDTAGNDLDWYNVTRHDSWDYDGCWNFCPLIISYPGGSMRIGWSAATGGYEVGSQVYAYKNKTYLPPVGDDWTIAMTKSGGVKWQSSFDIYFYRAAGIPHGTYEERIQYEPGDDTSVTNLAALDAYRYNPAVSDAYNWEILKIEYGLFEGWSSTGYLDIYEITTEGLIGPQEPTTITGQTLLRCGVPIVRFSVHPYTTFNCEVGAAYNLTNTNLLGGVVFLAADGNNYLAAIAEKGTVKIIKVRDAVETELASTSYSFSDDKFWIMAKHIDGEIFVWISEGFGNPDYGSPTLTYRWTDDDGSICTSDDIMHVGTYSMIDTPWVRVTGWQPGETNYVGILPDTIDKLTEFPSSGTILVNGKEISYTSKVAQSDAHGPYQCRNTTNWPSYSRDGHSYSGGNAIEFTRFEWADDSANYDRYNGYLMASNIGEAHVITASDFKPWITTGGKLVILKNRMRCFASDIDDNVHGFSEKMWITGGFAGCANEGDEEYSLIEGDVAFLYGDDYLLQLLGFVASSGHEDATVEDMIEKIMYMSAAEPSFPGDTLISSQALSSSETEIT